MTLIKSLCVYCGSARGRSPRYVAAVEFDGRPQAAVWLDVQRLRRGGTLDYTLVDRPDPAGWGARAEDAPPALCPSRP